MILEILTLLTRLAIAVVCWVVAPVVKHWIETQTENEKIERIKQAAETAAYAAEQLMCQADPTGTKRYNFVVSAVLAASEKVGIKLSEDEIKTIIEAAVQELNIVKHGWCITKEEESEGEIPE